MNFQKKPMPSRSHLSVENSKKKKVTWLPSRRIVYLDNDLITLTTKCLPWQWFGYLDDEVFTFTRKSLPKTKALPWWWSGYLDDDVRDLLEPASDREADDEGDDEGEERADDAEVRDLNTRRVDEETAQSKDPEWHKHWNSVLTNTIISFINVTDNIKAGSHFMGG